MAKNRLNGLEIELASSVLYYDHDELDQFLGIFDAVSSDSNIIFDGLFTQFVSYLNKWKINFDWEKTENPEERKQSIIDFCRLSNDQVPNSKERESFEVWLGKVLETNVPMELAEDILYHLVWEEYKNAVNRVDASDLPFVDKLAIRPKIPQSLISDGIIMFSDIEVEDENYYNRYSTGLKEFDEIIHLVPGNLLVVAARPGVGKTLYMINQAIKNASKGIKCLLVSLEMNKKQIDERVVNYYIGENLKDRFKDDNGFLDMAGYKKAVEDVKTSKPFKKINDYLHLYVSKKSFADLILSQIEEEVKLNHYEMIYLDYLQLLKYAGMDEWASLRALTKDLKNLAFRLGIIIVTGSQVSRSSEQTGLYLSNLFGSQSIEADADIVIGLEEFRERKSGKLAIINVKTLKNRDGDKIEMHCQVDYSAGKIELSNI